MTDRVAFHAVLGRCWRQASKPGLAEYRLEAVNGEVADACACWA